MTYILEEGEEDHQLDGNELRSRLMGCKIVSHLDKEENKPLHSDRDCDGTEDHIPQVKE